MQLRRICFEYEHEDGRVTTRTLEGPDAEQWGKWLKQVCLDAFNRRRSPDWGSLLWQDDTHQIIALNKEPSD
jgi:hypothetical protein